MLNYFVNTRVSSRHKDSEKERRKGQHSIHMSPHIKVWGQRKGESVKKDQDEMMEAAKY